MLAAARFGQKVKGMETNNYAGSSAPRVEPSNEPQGETFAESRSDRAEQQGQNSRFQGEYGAKSAQTAKSKKSESIDAFSQNSGKKSHKNENPRGQSVTERKMPEGNCETPHGSGSYTSDFGNNAAFYDVILRNLLQDYQNQTLNVVQNKEYYRNLLQQGAFGALNQGYNSRANHAGENADFTLQGEGLPHLNAGLAQAISALNLPFNSQQNYIPAPHDSNLLPNSVQGIISSDLKKIDSLLENGAMTQEQGYVLKNEILQNAYKNVVHNTSTTQNQVQQALSNLIGDRTFNVGSEKLSGAPDIKCPVAAFESTRPDFFTKTEARKNLKTYLEETLEGATPDELEKIAEIAEALELHAIDDYKAVSAHEKNISENNQLAKSRLATDSGRQKQSNIDSRHIFTRAEIRGFTTEQWRKHRAEILRQSNKGLIK